MHAKPTDTEHVIDKLEDLERWGEAGARLEFHKLIQRIAGVVPSVLPQLARDLAATITRTETRIGALEPPPSREELARAHRVLSNAEQELRASLKSHRRK